MKNRNLHAGKPAEAESSAAYIDVEKTFGARNYDPLPVVLSHGEGAGCGTSTAGAFST